MDEIEDGIKMDSKLAAHNIATILTQAMITDYDKKAIIEANTQFPLSYIFQTYAKTYAAYYKTFYREAYISLEEDLKDI